MSELSRWESLGVTIVAFILTMIFGVLGVLAIGVSIYVVGWLYAKFKGYKSCKTT